MSVWNSIDELLSDDHHDYNDDEKLISSQDTLDQNELLGIDDEEYELFVANETQQSPKQVVEKDCSIQKEVETDDYKEIESTPPPLVTEKRKINVKHEESPRLKIVKVESTLDVIDDEHEYLVKLEEQKRKREEIIKMKEKRRQEAIMSKEKPIKQAPKDDIAKKVKLNALLDTYLDEISKEEVKVQHAKPHVHKPMRSHAPSKQTNPIYPPRCIPQPLPPTYDQVPLIYAPQGNIAPNTYIINPTLNIMPSLMLPPLLQNPTMCEPRFHHLAHNLNQLPMIERNHLIRNIRPTMINSLNNPIFSNNIIQIKPIETYPKAILYNLSVNTSEKHLINMCHAINLKEKVK